MLVTATGSMMDITGTYEQDLSGTIDGRSVYKKSGQQLYLTFSRDERAWVIDDSWEQPESVLAKSTLGDEAACSCCMLSFMVLVSDRVVFGVCHVLV